MSKPPEDHRWEWRLPSGVGITATLDASEQTESVYVEGRLVSQAPRGGRPAGHVLADPAGVTLTFQPNALICILRVDGEEVPPLTWPVRRRAERAKPRVLAFPGGIVLAAVVVVAAAVLAFFVLDRRRAAPTTAERVHRADNGRFVVHVPSSFTARRAVVPSGMSGVVLDDAERGEAVVLLALATGDVPREPWLVHKRLHAEALAIVPRGSTAFEERARTDETCAGQPGAAVRGRVKSTEVWSCAFVHDGAAYLALFALPDDATSEDEHRLRAIVDGTELTSLGEIRGAE